MLCKLTHLHNLYNIYYIKSMQGTDLDSISIIDVYVFKTYD